MMNNKTLKKNPRQSNIELLRIFSMFLIVFSHFSVHGKVQFADLSLGINKIFLESICTGNIGVIIFVIISGYFMCKSKFQLRRILSIEFQMLFYSIIIYATNLAVNKTFSVVSLVKAFLPLISGTWWFCTTYIILCLFAPFINKLLLIVSRKQFIILNIVLLFTWSIIPTFLKLDGFKIGGYIAQFITYYCIGAYLRMYPDNILTRKKSYKFLLAISSVLLLLSLISIEVLGSKISIFASHGTYFY